MRKPCIKAAFLLILTTLVAGYAAAAEPWASGWSDRSQSAGEGDRWGWYDSKENRAIIAVNNSFSAAYQYSYLYYVEPSGGQTGASYSDYESGSLNGGQVAVNFMLPAASDFYFHGEWSGSEGQVNYNGFDFNGNPVAAISRATIQDYDFKLGKGCVTGERWMITPYGTFGGHHWLRELGLGTINDYDESYNHYYFGLGSMFQFAPSEDWVLTADATVGRTFNASINTSSTPLGSLDNARLRSGPVIKLGLEADYRMNESPFHFFTGFNYQTFDYNQSDVQSDGLFEPVSFTQIFYWTVGFRVAYF